MKILSVLRELPRLAAIGLIRVYQWTLSPLLGPRCRFEPSCSSYACECFEHHGFWRGSVLTAKRLGRCHPFHPGGYDPAPEAGALDRPPTALEPATGEPS